jgi:hypothetical protein
VTSQVSPLRGWAVGCVAFALAVALPGSARAEDTDAAPSSKPARVESPEYPHVRMTIDPSGHHTWVLHIQNTDSIPLKLVGDVHLLSLDVTPAPTSKAAHPATVHCTLPAEMRPWTDEERLVVVPPKLSFIEAFDPRLYCFDARADRAMSPGATVVGRFGFAPTRGKATPPFVLASSRSEDRSPMKQILGEPFTLPEPEPTEDTASSEVPKADEDDANEPRPTLSTPARIDASGFRDLAISVTVTNPTPRTMHLLLRAETLAFVAQGPQGMTRCSRFVASTPIPELFTTLPPHGRTTTEVLVGSLCPAAFFGRPGLYSLRAELDTSATSGAPIGIHAFVGQAESKSSTLLRLRTAPKRVELP